MSNAVNGLGLAGGVVGTTTVFNPMGGVTQGFTVATTPANGPSGTLAVAGIFTGAGQSAPFSPIAGRPFNATFAFTGGGSVALQRSFDNGQTWFTTDVLSTSDSSSYVEPELGVIYQLNCTAASGSITYRLSQ